MVRFWQKVDLEVDAKRLNCNDNLKFMPFGISFVFMPFGNNAIREVTIFFITISV